MILEQLFFKKIFDEAYQALKRYIKSKGLSLLSAEEDIQSNISSHITYIDNWSSSITFRDLGANSKNLSNIYVNLNYLSAPKDCQLIESYPKKVTLDNILKDNDQHILILGQPGSGKTTTMKYIAHNIIHNELFYQEEFRFPLLIRLRTLSFVEKSNFSCGLLFDIIISTIGLRISKNTSIEENFSVQFIKDSAMKFIETLQVLIILDGFDEIASLKNRNAILQEVEELTLSLSQSKIILTSRTGDFPYKIDKTAIYEVAPLNSKQIVELSRKWINSDAQCKLFLDKINKSPFKDSSIRPLTMSHLCAIFERYGDIPEKPKTIYRKIVNLLIEEWDEQRNIKRFSRLGSFDPDRKIDFLSNLAYYASTELKKTIFTRDELIYAYEQIHQTFNLPKDESKKVIMEIESHTGLFIQSGFDSFEFVHKSIQEYLSALYFVKLPTTPDNPDISIYLSNEFAIAISLASDQTAYFYMLVFTTIEASYRKDKLNRTFFDAFLNRVIIEKPDFRPSVFLGVSFLYLLHMAYELYDCGRRIENDIFDLLLQNNAVKQSVSLATKYYEVSPKSDARYPLIRLEKKRNAKDQFVVNLPNEIAIKRKYFG